MPYVLYPPTRGASVVPIAEEVTLRWLQHWGRAALGLEPSQLLPAFDRVIISLPASKNAVVRHNDKRPIHPRIGCILRAPIALL